MPLELPGQLLALIRPLELYERLRLRLWQSLERLKEI
jgi:hypothetical protein